MGGYLSTYTALEMTCLLPNLWSTTDYSTKCLIILPTGKKYGEWVTFKYVEYLSRQNHSKHWVYDVNNSRHDPIGNDQVCNKKWCPTQKFTLIFSVAEANTVYSRTRGRKAIPDHQLEFRRRLVLGMLKKNLDNEGVSINSPIFCKKRYRGPGSRWTSLWVVLPTPECGIRGIMGGPKLRHNMWKLSVLPAKRGSEPIVNAIRKFLCEHNVLGSTILTAVTQTREL